MARNLLLLFSIFIINCTQAQEVHEIAYWAYKVGFIQKDRKGAVYLEFYNADRLLSEKRNGNNSDSLYTKERTVYEYDDKHRKISETEYSMLNKIMVQRHYEYGENGLLKKMWYSYRNKKGDSQEWKELYFYEGAGNLARKIRTYGSAYYFTTETSVFEYEEKNGLKTVTERMNTTGRKKTVKTVRMYNEYDLLVNVTENKKKMRYAYEYNAAGEWVKMKICTYDGFLGPWRCEGEYRKTLIK
jgi:hypothetical protein